MDPFAQLLIQWIGMVRHTLLEASSEWEHVGDVSPVVDVLRKDNRREVVVTTPSPARSPRAAPTRA